MSSSLALSGVEWVKSSYSGNGGANCVEWAQHYAEAHGIVPVRDSKVPSGPTLLVSPDAWASLIRYATDSPV
ncbi:DUF397 domain-containing protein [Streptomyces sp. NPDC004838]